MKWINKSNKQWREWIRKKQNVLREHACTEWAGNPSTMTSPLGEVLVRGLGIGDKDIEQIHYVSMDE